MADRIYADLQKTDDEGRLVLVTWGTHNDLKARGIELAEGLTLDFYTDDADDDGNRDDLHYSGVVTYNHDLGAWVAEVDDSRIRHASDPDEE